MAQSHSKLLTSFQIKKLNLILRTGHPIERWKNVITLLIEKSRGNISFDKMRAIEVFEADFNWTLKKLLSQRLMKKAREDGTLPEEAYAIAGTSATEVTLTRILWCDVNHFQHKSHALVSADLGQCYDSVAHVPCSLSLQAFGTPRKFATLVLYTLQVMTFSLSNRLMDDCRMS